MSSQSKLKWWNLSILLRVGGCLLLLSVIVSLLMVALTIKQVRFYHQEIRQEINEISNEVSLLYSEDGLIGVLEEYELEDTPQFDFDTMLQRFDHDELIFALRSPTGNLITGAQELPFKQGWHRAHYSFEQEVIRVFGKGSRLDNGATLMLQMPINDYPIELRQHLKQRMLLILLFSLLLWPLLTWVISRYINKQIKRLSAELSLVAAKPDEKRLSTNTNSTEFTQLAMALKGMLDQVSQIHRNMQTMSVGIAHDLKTPLSRVANRLQMMQQDIDDKASLTTHIDKANGDLSGIVRTFSNLIRLNEIESGRRKSGFIKLDFSHLVSELADSYLPVFEDHNKQLDISVVDDVMCLGDGDLLSQLISNLLENALAYSDDGAKVWLRLQSHANGALLQIGDSGPGIPRALSDHVFERFYRADYSRAKPGNGLGLSIVKAICDLHDANITLLQNQAGAVFDIVLPIQKS